MLFLPPLLQGPERPPTPALDRAAILADLYKRQALRREAKLPLLKIRAAYARLVHHALWTAFVERHYLTVRANVLADLRAKHGPGWGYSAGGRWVVEIVIGQRLRAMFEESEIAQR